MLRFVPPNKLTGVPQPAGFHPQSPTPVADLRSAVIAGTARDEGRTTLRGRTVERICVDPNWDRDHWSACHPGGPSDTCPVGGGEFFFVDPGTFYPVEQTVCARIV